MKYDIQVNPMNPVEYLACCGVFDILARFDGNAVSWWEIEPQPRFLIESEIDEASLLACLKETLSDWGQWRSREGENRNDESLVAEDVEDNAEETDGDEEEGVEGISLNPQFSMNDTVIRLNVDWWYETLTPEKQIKKKSAWKMYAGQQTAEKISRAMTDAAALLLKESSVNSLTELVKLSTGMTGRFGFDPRSSRNALDAGYSANDLKLPIATCPFAELLTTIAAQYFFPQRNRQSGGITSSRGWIANDVFQYALWMTPLPITLARMAAIGVAVSKNDVITLQAERANRDKYSNFRMATMAAWKADN
jgi:CRISPR-associated protein Csb3